jgi:hypothetical protein
LSLPLVPGCFEDIRQCPLTVTQQGNTLRGEAQIFQFQ